MIKILSRYAGSRGMAGGEALDVATKDQQVSLKTLLSVYKLKTSYLICASAMLAALSANITDAVLLRHIEKFGINLGLAFQIQDDIIELEYSTKVTGKSQSDLINHKVTYPQIVGINKAKSTCKRLLDRAEYNLKACNIESSQLADIIQYVIHRHH